MFSHNTFRTPVLLVALFIAVTSAFTSTALSQGFGKVQSGVTTSPSVIYGNGSQSNHNLGVTFTLKETNGAPITFSSVTCAILKNVNGVYSHQFDLPTFSNVTLAANGTWTYSTTGYISSPGDYRAVARGKVGTGAWFDFQVTGSGVNPRGFTALPVPLSLAVSPSTTQSVTPGGTYSFSFSVTGLGSPVSSATINFYDPIINVSANVITDGSGNASYSRTVPHGTSPASYTFNFVASKTDHQTSASVQRGVQVTQPPAPVISMNQSLSVGPTRSNPETIFALPPFSEYDNIEPVENEKNFAASFRLANTGNASVTIADWGILVTGGISTNFRLTYGQAVTLLPAQTSPLFSKRGWITDNQLNATPTTCTAQVQVNIGGTWSNVSGSGSSTTFPVYPRPTLTNGTLVKRPRNVNSSNPDHAKVYYHQNNKKWEGTVQGFNGLFPSWESGYYVYPIATIQGMGTPAPPIVNTTIPMVTGRNMLYKSGIDVYIIEPEPGTSSPLKSRLFDDEAAFYSYGYTPQQLGAEPIAMSSAQVNWLQSTYPVGSLIAVGTETFGNPVSNPVITCVYNDLDCADRGKYHTAIDYGVASGSTIKASARGLVTSVTINGQSDHGLGNCVIVRHNLTSGGTVFSLYAHLSSIASGIAPGVSVTKGQTLGVMGGSGYGNPNFWSTHLHFEIKNTGVLHNPSGSGTYYGYTPTSANNFGYHNPASFIGTVSVGGPLPVTLAAFTAIHAGGNRVRLNWTTISETNNLGFHVQRMPAPDSVFVTLPNSFVPGHGTTITPRHYTFVDSSAGHGAWVYRLEQVDLDGTVSYSEPVAVDIIAGIAEGVHPATTALLRNYPNPFNSSTRIAFTVARHTHVELRVYDLLGRVVAVPVDRRFDAGLYSVPFNADNLASGTYLCRLFADGIVQTRKVVLLR